MSYALGKCLCLIDMHDITVVFICTKHFMTGANLEYQHFVAVDILSQILFADSRCLLLFDLSIIHSDFCRGLFRHVLGHLFVYMYVHIYTIYMCIYICIHILSG